MRPSLIPSLLCFAFCFPLALSFSVTVGSPPNECGSLTVSWTGGQAPFQIALIPVFNIPRNISVPSSAFSNGQGSYQISPFPFTKGTQFLVAMSDATGFGTGGATELLAVGASAENPTCNTTNPALPFSFSLPSSLGQCSPFTFSQYDGAALPVTITGFIPGGDVFILHPPPTGASFSWVADVAAGTTIIFAMTDANGISGGSSDAEVVTHSNDASCLNKNSPSSTASSAPPLTTSASSTSSPTQTSTSSGASPGTIAGAAIGAVLAVAATVVLAVCCLKRKGYGRSPYGLAPRRNSRRPNSVELDPGMDNFQHPPINPFPYQSNSVTRLAPPVSPSSPSYQGTLLTSPSVHASETPYSDRPHSRTNSNTDSFAALGGVASSTMTSSARRKAAMAGVSGYQPTTRFIVHTDAEDVTPESEPELVELPPQYSERRTPAAPRKVPSVSGLPSSDLAYLSSQYVDEPPQSPPRRPPQ